MNLNCTGCDKVFLDENQVQQNNDEFHENLVKIFICKPCKYATMICNPDFELHLNSLEHLNILEGKKIADHSLNIVDEFNFDKKDTVLEKIGSMNLIELLESRRYDFSLNSIDLNNNKIDEVLNQNKRLLDDINNNIMMKKRRMETNQMDEDDDNVDNLEETNEYEAIKKQTISDSMPEEYKKKLDKLIKDNRQLKWKIVRLEKQKALSNIVVDYLEKKIASAYIQADLELAEKERIARGFNERDIKIEKIRTELENEYRKTDEYRKMAEKLKDKLTDRNDLIEQKDKEIFHLKRENIFLVRALQDQDISNEKPSKRARYSRERDEAAGNRSPPSYNYQATSYNDYYYKQSSRSYLIRRDGSFNISVSNDVRHSERFRRDDSRNYC